MSQALESPVPASGAQAEQRREVAAAMWKALNTAPEDIVRDNERLAALEASLKQLREDSAQTRRSLETMNARLQAAESQRGGGSTLVYALIALCVALGALVLWLWVRGRRAAAHQWWDPETQAAMAAQRDSRLAAEAASSVIDDETPQDAWHEPPSRLGRGKPATAPGTAGALDTPVARSGPMTTQAAPFLAERTTVLPRPAPQAIPLPPAPAPDLAPAGKVSVEELIDLEQQAEFFEALGQDESAIDLLLSHVTEHPDASPLPYLKLLEIYRRRGDREAYEGTRQRFNDRFNAYAPAWEEDQRDGRSLEDYPSVISRLQGLWEAPQRALDVLQASLLRRDETTQTFDLPAYRELLMLYSVARDRVGMDDGRTGVDVLLPLEGDEVEDDYATRLEPLTATTPVRPYDGPEPAVEVDLQLELDDDWGRSHVLVRPNEAVETPEPNPAPAAPAEPPIYDRGIEFEPIHLDLPDTGKPRGPERKA